MTTSPTTYPSSYPRFPAVIRGNDAEKGASQDVCPGWGFSEADRTLEITGPLDPHQSSDEQNVPNVTGHHLLREVPF